MKVIKIAENHFEIVHGWNSEFTDGTIFMSEKDAQRAIEIEETLLGLCLQFPGLVNGEEEVNGSNLIEYLSKRLHKII